MLRNYKTMDELTRDFWSKHYAYKKRHTIPNTRLLEMSDDISRTKEQRTMARSVWNNLWILKNSKSGMCWTPEHHKRTIKYFNDMNQVELSG